MGFSKKDIDFFYFYSVLSSKNSFIAIEVLFNVICDVYNYNISKKEKTQLIYKKIADSYHDINNYNKNFNSQVRIINFRSIKDIEVGPNYTRKLIATNTGLENQVLFLILFTEYSIQEIGHILDVKNAKIIQVINELRLKLSNNKSGKISIKKRLIKLMKREDINSHKVQMLGILNNKSYLTSLFFYDKTIQILVFSLIFFLGIGFLIFLNSKF